MSLFLRIKTSEFGFEFLAEFLKLSVTFSLGFFPFTDKFIDSVLNSLFLRLLNLFSVLFLRFRVGLFFSSFFYFCYNFLNLIRFTFDLFQTKLNQ